MELFELYKIGGLGKEASIEVVGESLKTRHVLSRVNIVAPTNMTVILQGESGTGKEIIAKLIHEESPRKSRPFIAVDCGAIPETLIESELFGFEKGAFTGANERREGKFECASTGTLFLDEITNLSHQLQAKLLRVIQERKVQRLGSAKEIKIDVRIIAATNAILFDEVKSGKFRSDLYYRINEFDIHLPPLRERKEDIPLLVIHFLYEASVDLNKSVSAVSTEAMETLLSYRWPGNIRELRNLIRRAVLLADSSTIESISLPHPATEGVDLKECLKKGMSLSDIVKGTSENVERELIEIALTQAKNNKTMAAKILNINRVTLYSKMKSLGLCKELLTGL